jgi:hypothetical protein
MSKAASRDLSRVSELSRDVSLVHCDCVSNERVDMAKSLPISGRSVGSSPSIFDLGNAVHLCFDRYDMFQIMVRCFFTGSDELIGGMRSALNQKSATELGDLAHQLKGTICYFSAPVPLAAIKRLEDIGRSGVLSDAEEALNDVVRLVSLLKTALAPHFEPASADDE